MIPEELSKKLDDLVRTSFGMLRILQVLKPKDGSRIEDTELYSKTLKRFKKNIVEASNRIDTIRYFTSEQEFNELLKKFNCTWDECKSRLKLPDLPDKK